MFWGQDDDNETPLPVEATKLWVSSSIHEYEDSADLTPTILHMDYNGYWTPLSHLYFSTSSKILVARHPDSCEEELQGFLYCPQCLTRYQSEDVKQYFNRCPTCFTCPRCTSVLTIASVSSSSSSRSEDGQVELKCDSCPWRSSSSNIVGKTRGDLESCIFSRENDNDANKAFKVLLDAYCQADAAFLANRDSKSNSAKHDLSYYLKHGVDNNHSGGKVATTKTTEEAAEMSEGIFESERWDVQKLEEKLARQAETMFDYDPNSESPLYRYLSSQDPSWEETMRKKEESLVETLSNITDLDMLTSLDERQPCIEIGTAAVLASNLLPARVRLRTRRTLRCRRDVKEGKLSILLQPKTLPLEGDSSQKLQRGKWWLKDASAIHTIPRIILRKVPQFADILQSDGKASNTNYVDITITNPREVAVTIELKNLQPHESGNDLLTLHPILKEEDVILSLSLNNPSPPIEIGSYEDELLLEDDDDEISSSSTGAGGGDREWRMNVKHNVARISIPVEVENNENMTTKKLAVLNFTMIVKNADDGEITEVFSKMILP